MARTALPQALTTVPYNAANQLTNWGSAALSYDANGNMLSDGASTFTWNPRDQLVRNRRGVCVRCFGRRVAKLFGSSQTNFLFDGPNSLQEQGPDGSVVANILTGFGPDENLVRTDAAGTHAFLTDALGSTVALAEGDGTMSARYTFDPFGGTSVSGASLNTAEYTGRENDSTGLYFYRARYYSPTFSRFVSEDPMGPLSGDLNFYRYASGNPVQYRDPDGTSPLGALIGGFYGGVYGALGAATAGGNFWAGAGIGALAGAAAAALDPLDPSAGALGGAAGGYAGNALTQLQKTGQVDQGQAIGSALAGAVGGATGGGIGAMLDEVGASSLESALTSGFVGNNIGFPLDTLFSSLLKGKVPSPRVPHSK